MAWSYAVRLKDYDSAPSKPGVYEVGFIRNNVFNALYAGKSDKSIYERLKSHYCGTGNKNIEKYLLEHSRDNLWCHWMKVSDPSFTEGNLLNDYGIKKDGLYKYNKKLEKRTERS